MAGEEEVKELVEFSKHNYDLEEPADMGDFACLSVAALQKVFSMTFYRKNNSAKQFYISLFWIFKLGVPKGKKVSEKDNGKRLLIISLRNKLRLFNGP